MSRSLRPYLEYTADKVEATLAAHRAPARVTGGKVGPFLIRFVLQPAPHIRYAQIAALKDDLTLAIQTTHLNITLDKGIVLEFPRPDPQALTLQDLVDSYGNLPAVTAALGVSADSAPLCARLSSPSVAHILVAGTTGCGKSNLLRVIAASLLMTNNTEALNLVAIDPKNRTFPRDFHAPHLIRNHIITDTQESVEVLNSLVTLMDIRDRRSQSLPHIIVIIDELADLIMNAGGGIEPTLVRLAQSGRQTGIHLIGATQRPSAAILSGLMRANIPLRLVGHVVSPEDSRIAAGRGGVGAERLAGRGDFVAVAGDGNTRFQVPLVRPQEILDIVNVSHLPTGQAITLPAPDTTQPLATPTDLDILTARLKPWWNENGYRFLAGEWGIQKEAISVLYPGDPNATNAGYWRENMLKVVERLASEDAETANTTTTTQLLPAFLTGKAYPTG